MSDVTIAGLRADTATAFGEYMASLVQSGSVWAKSPAGAAEGEAAWNGQQVAEHIGQAASFFGGAIAKLIGVEAGPPAAPSFADVAAAAAGTPAAHLGLMAVVDQVTDAQLAIETEFGPLGKTTLGSVLGILGYHYRDHAKQLAGLRG